MNKVLRSSANSENLSLTIKGLLVALIPIIIMIASKAGVMIVQGEAMEVVNALFAVVSSAIVAVGLIRKIYIKARK